MTQSSGSITTTNDAIQFAGVVVLTGNSVFSTGAGAGNIVFSSTVDGPGGLNLTAGSGNITFTGAVGATVRLGDLTIVSVANLTAGNITATTITQTAGSGTSTFGNLNTNGVGGIHKTGTNFLRTGSVTTTNGGPLVVNNSGTLTVVSNPGTSVSGAYQQTGSGPVNIGDLITANGISFAGPITMSSALTLNSNNGDIGLANTIDATTASGQALTLTAGTGTITVTAAIGGTTRIGTFTVNSCKSMSTVAITASSASISQIAVDLVNDKVSVNGDFNTNAPAGIVLNLTNFFRGGAITATNGGPLLATFSGIITGGSPSPITVGSLQATNVGSGILNFQGSVITDTGGITYNTPLNLVGTATFNSSTANGNIFFSSTIDGGQALNLNAGSGNITLTGAVGATTRLGNVTIVNVNNLTAANITAATITQSAGSGTSTFQNLNTNAAGGIHKTGTNFVRSGSVTTTNGGDLVVYNAGTLTVTSNPGTNVSGAYQQTGPGSVTVGDTITANGISFAGPITMSSALSLNSGNSNISFTNTIDATTAGSQELTMTAGTGTISTTSAIGGTTRIGALTVNSCLSVTVQAVNATSINITETGGTVTFSGDISTNGILGITLNANNFVRGGGITASNGGPFVGTLTGTVSGGSPKPITVGSLTLTSAGTLSSGGTVIATTGNITYNTNLNLLGNATIDSSQSGGAITFNGTVNGAKTLTVTAGTGSITFTGTIGGITALTALSATGSAISLNNIGGAAVGISGTATLTASSSITFSGTNYYYNTQSYTVPSVIFNSGATTTLKSASTSISFSATSMSLAASTNLTIDTSTGGGGDVTLSALDAVTGDLRSLAITAGTGAITLSSIGTASSGEFASVSLNGGDISIGGNILSNAVSFTSTGTIYLGANITTSNSALIFPVAVIRNAVNGSILTTAGGAITFSSTLDGDADNTRTLNLAAGAGSITFTGAVGSTHPLNVLTITSANNVTTAAMSVASLTQSAGTGTTTFSGALATTNNLGISLTGTAFTFNSTVNTTGGGPLVIANSGLATLAGTFTLSGALTQSGAGTVSLANGITAGDIVSFAGPVTLAGTSTISTATAGRAITFSNTVNGGNDLTLAAGLGNVTFSSAVGGTTRVGALVVSSSANITTQALSAASINFTWTVGSFTLNGAMNTNGASGITLTGVNIVNNGSVTTTGSAPGDGPYNITTTGTTSGTPTGATDVWGSITQSATGIGFLGGTFTTHTGNISTAHNINLVAPVTVNTLSGGTLTLSGTVDGAFGITVNSHGGDVVFGQTLGASTPLGALSIVGANNVTTQSIRAASFSQTTGTGTTTFNGAITTTGSSGIAIATAAVTRAAAMTASNTGGITINNSSLFTSTAAGDITAGGAFAQTGAGNVTISGSIVTNGSNISFASPLALAGNLSLDTGTGTGAITLSQTVNGASNLSLKGNSGNITLSGIVGGTTRLVNVTFVSGATISTQAIYAATITQSGGTGTSTFGLLDTNAVGGITLTGTNFALSGAITTTAAGPLTITSSGTTTYSSSASIAGALSQGGSAALSGATLAITGTAQFLGATTVSGTNSVSTTNQTLSFASTIDGGGNLTLDSGTGAITLTGAVGGTTRLGDFVISHVGNLTAANITAATFTQSNGSGTSSFQNLNTNAAGGIHKTGTNFVRSGSITTTNGGDVVVDNSGTLTVSSNLGTNVSGFYHQIGSGPVVIGDTINASGISFAGPMTLSATLTLNSNNQPIAFTNTVDAMTSGGQALTLTAGTGDITFSAAVGSTTRIGAFTVNSCTNMTISDFFAASWDITETGGSVTFNGTHDTNGPAGVVLNVNNVIRNGTLNASNGGPLNVNFTGTIGGASVSPITAGSVSVNNLGGGTLGFGGTIITTAGGITMNSILNLLAATTFDTSQAGGNITFSGSSTINGNKNLTLTAGTGNITFNAVVGATTPLNAIVINSAGNVTAAAISAASVSGSTITGLATFNGALTTTGASGIVFSANQVTINSDVTTTGGGPFSIALTGASPLTIASGHTLSIGGAFAQTGTGSVSLGSPITTTNGNISFASAVTLASNVALDTSAGNKNIVFSNAVNGTTSAGQTLGLKAGTGNITATGSIGSGTRIGAVTVTSCTDMTVAALSAASINVVQSGGTVTFGGDLNTNAIAGITLNLTNLIRGGGFTATNGGPLTTTFSGTVTGTSSTPITVGSLTTTNIGVGILNFRGTVITDTGGITYNTPVNLVGAATFNTSAVNGAIHFSSTIDGAQSLNFTAGSGAIAVDGAIGGTTPIGALSISSASTVTTAAISATSIAASSVTGLTHFTGALSTTGASGIVLSGAAFTLDSTATTTSSGPVSITHTGTLTLPFGSNVSTDGAFTELGSGSVSLGANLTATNDNISWARPITLTHDVTMNSGAGAGNITLSNTVSGAFCLTLSAGTGTVQLSGALNTNCLSASAATILQSAAITTTSTVAFTGNASIGANITTTNSAITITGNVTRTTANNVTLSTGVGAGNIAITGTVDGNVAGRSLTLSAGTGSVTIGGTVGGVIPLETLTITGSSAQLANFGTAPSATNGNLSIDVGAGALSFTGTSYQGGTQSYTAGSYSYSSAATVASGGGDITYNSGPIAISGNLTINSNGGVVTLTDLTGPGHALDINAAAGVVHLTNVGSSGALSAVNVTATSYSLTGTSNPAVTFTPFSGAVLLSGTIAGPQTYGPAVLTGDTILNGVFTFTDTLNGAHTLTINPGGGTSSVTFSGLVGNTTPLTSVTISACQDVTISNEMIVGSFTQTGGTGTTMISAGINADAGGISIDTDTISIAGSTVTTNNAPAIFTGNFTSTGSVFNLDGALMQSGGAVSIGGTIHTTNDVVSFGGAVSLSNDLTIDTVTTTGGAIEFGSTVDGPYNIDLTAGSQPVTFADAVGGTTRVGTVTIESAGYFNATDIKAASLTQVTGVGPTTFTGVIDTNTLGGINLAGGAFTFGGAVTTSASGPVVIQNTGTLTLAAVSASGAITQTGGGSVVLGGNITSDQNISFAGAIAVANPTLFDTSANGTNITLSSTVNGPSDLEFNLGTTGLLSISGNVGSTTRVGAFLIDNAQDVTAQNITATTITQTTGSGITTLGALNTSLVGGISLTGNEFSISGNVVTTTAGPVAIVNTGALTVAAGSGTSISGAFTQSGGGSVSLSGTLLTTDQPISFTNAITLAGTTLVSNSSGSQNITFGSTIDGTQNLTLTAGTGNLVFGGAIGVGSGLNTLTIQSCTDVTYPETRANTIVQVGSSGTTTISAEMQALSSGGISLTGATIAQNGELSSASSGAISIIHTNTWTQGATIQSGGAFNESGGGAVSLNGNIASASADISMAGAISLVGAVSLNSSSGAGDVLLAGTVDGNNDLTLTAGTGIITLGSAIGGTTRIANLIIASASDMSAGDIKASSISQTAGSGTTTLGGAINTNGVAGVSLTGTNFAVNSSITTSTASTGAAVSINNSGTLAFGSSATLNLAGGFAQNGTGATTLQGSITTGSSILFQGAVSIPTSGLATLNSSNNLIEFSSAVNGPGSMACTAGSGNLTFSANVGSTTALTAITINSAATVSTQGVRAGTITQTAGSVLTTFNGDLTATTGAINLGGTGFTFVGNATSAGNFAIVNSGTLTTSVNSTLLSSGTFAQSGAGSVSLAGTVRTTGSALSFAGPITLISAAALSNTGGSGNITLSSTVDGAQSFTLTGGTGTISIGDIGTNVRVGAITVVSTKDINLANLFATSYTQQAGTGQFSLIGAFNTNGPAGISLTGNAFSRQGALVTTNGGNLTFLNSGAVTGAPGNTANVDGQWRQLAGSTGTVNLGGTITAKGGFSIIGPFSLVGDAILDASGGTGGISIANTVNGAHTFTLQAGAGNVSITQPIGASSALTGFTITGNQVALANVGGASQGVSGTTSITATGAIQFTGTTYNMGAQTYNAPTQFDMNAGALTTLSSNGAAITFQNGQILLAAGTNLTINTAGGALTTQAIRAGGSAARTLILSTGSGALQVGQIGLAADGEFTSASLSGGVITLGGDLIANTIAVAPTTTLNVGGNITSTNTPISFPTAVVLNTNSTISTGTGGNITFSGTLNGLSANTQNITLRAGTGDISFNADVGTNFLTRPNLMTIATARNVTIGNMTVNGLIQSAGTGTTTISGTVSIVNNIGFQFTGTNANLQNTGLIQTTTGSSVTIHNSGIFTLAGTVNPDGAFIQNHTGSTAFSGSIVTNQGSISFTGPVVVSGTCSMNSSNNNQPISFSNTLDGGGNLTLRAGAGDITLSGNAGGTTPLGTTTVARASNITIQNMACLSLNATATGTMRLVGNLSSSGAAGITLVGVNFIRSGTLITTGGGNFTVTNSGTITGTSINTTSIDGTYTQNGTGPVFFAGVITTNNNNISFASPITLLAGGGFDTGAGAGNIILSGTVNGGSSLSFNAGVGDVILNATIGSITPLGNITITTAANVTAPAINAASITQLNGTDTSTFNGAIVTTGSSGINLTGTNIVRNAAWTTNGTGGVAIANSGTFTTTAAGTIQSAGAFSQTGTGPVLISGNVITNNTAIGFAGPMSLIGTTTLNSGAGAGNISITGTVNGAQNFTLNAGTGSITTSGAIGSITRLNTLTLTQTATANLAGIRAAAIVQLAGTGTTTFSGVVNTNALSGIALTGANFTFSGAVTTTASGPITINNTGLFTLSAACNASGAFNQSGSGACLLSSSLNGSSSINFTGAVSVSGTASLTAVSSPITLQSTLNGPGNITFNAGAGAITLSGAAGSTTRLGTVTFAQATDISTLGIRAASITQTTGSGTTTIVGNLDTTNVAGINLAGTTFSITGSLLSTNLGPCSISHTGVLSLTAGSSTLLTGPFTESGTGGTVNLGGTVHASNANITFANPIVLTAATTLDSDGGGDILISSTIDGPFDLVYDAGTGSITLAANIGSTTPVSSLTITSANNVATQAISAGSIVQSAGSGTTTFNGALVASLSGGINLTGTAFTFNAPVTTLGGGALTINNSGALILSSAAPIDLAGSFSQTGAGAVSVETTIEVAGPQLLFTGPITLTGTSFLDMDGVSGTLTLLNTVNGNFNLSIESDVGNIVLSGIIGGITPLGAFQVNLANDFTSKAISAEQIVISGISGLATVNGTLSTTDASGISLSGSAFTLNGNVTTLNGGAFAITNSSALTIFSTMIMSLDGSFTQTGLGITNLGGTLTTNGGAIYFSGPMGLNGNLALNSNNGNITFGSDLDGAYSVTVTAGTGDVTVPVAFSIETPLQNFTVVSAHDIFLNGVGSMSSVMSGTLSLTASDTISLMRTIYAAHAQYYFSGADTDFINPGLVTLFTDGGAITFASATVHLNDATDLLIETNGGAFSFNAIHGTSGENLTIHTGSGLASLGTLPNIGSINTVTVTAGSILLNGSMNLINPSFTSQASILNAGAPVDIVSSNTAFFNAVNGNVGSVASPILIDSSQQILAGAVDLAAFDGSSIDNTVQVYAPNPPCIIYFNGVKIKDCGLPPGPSPSPVSHVTNLQGSPFFAVEGVYDSYFNYANNYYFFTYLLDDKYWLRSIPVFIRPSK